MLKSKTFRSGTVIIAAFAYAILYAAPEKQSIDEYLGEEFLLFEQSEHSLVTCQKVTDLSYACAKIGPDNETFAYELTVYKSESDVLLHHKSEKQDCNYSGAMRGNIIKGTYKCRDMAKVKEFKIVKKG